MAPLPIERIARLESEVAQLKMFVPRIEKVEDKISSFINRFEAKEEERDRVQEQMHEENKSRVAFWGKVIGGLSLLMSILETIHMLRH